MSSRLLVLSLVGLLVVACSKDPGARPDAGMDTDAEEPKLAFLASCQRSEQCEEDACLEVAKKQRICTKPCDKDSDCPAGSNWTCGTTREVEDALCLCLADGPELCGDG
jgi:hypothetical protein